jgi:hypothetical protein
MWDLWEVTTNGIMILGHSTYLECPMTIVLDDGFCITKKGDKNAD